MITQQYLTYIKSDAWEKKRQECFAYHGRKCKACGRMRGPIHVHHLDYTRLGRESAIHDLMPLCVDCHRQVTRIYRRNRRLGLRKVTMDFVRTKRELMKRKRNSG